MFKRCRHYSGVRRRGSQATAGPCAVELPARDITFIVPWNAGGSNDVAARALDPILREHGIKMVIENVVGATGTHRHAPGRNRGAGRLHHRHGHQFDAGADRAGQDAAEQCAVHAISPASRPIP